MPRDPRRSYNRNRVTTDAQTIRVDDTDDADAEEILEFLGDEYTRMALDAVKERPRSGREVADAKDISQPTAYRRLNRLVDLGFVAVEQSLDPKRGHHHKQYRGVIDSFSVQFTTAGLEIRADVDEPAPSHSASSLGVPAND